MAEYYKTMKQNPTIQTDIFRDTPEAMARVYRIAAETARSNPFMTQDEGEARARYYLREAERLEALK